MLEGSGANINHSKSHKHSGYSALQTDHCFATDLCRIIIARTGLQQSYHLEQAHKKNWSIFGQCIIAFSRYPVEF